jgi:hypothetical protein
MIDTICYAGTRWPPQATPPTTVSIHVAQVVGRRGLRQRRRRFLTAAAAATRPCSVLVLHGITVEAPAR